MKDAVFIGIIIFCATAPLFVGALLVPEKKTFFLGMGLFVLGLTFFLILLAKHRDSSIKKKIALIAADFGNIVSPEPDDKTVPEVCFKRNGTIFQIQVPETKLHCTYQVDFDFQPTGEKFFIQDDTYIFPKNCLSDCHPVHFPALTKSFLLYSRNVEFLLNLLNDKDIRLQIEKYPANTFMVPSLLKIAFESGHFEIVWRNSAHDMDNKIRSVCETAVVFHDKIKGLVG